MKHLALPCLLLLALGATPAQAADPAPVRSVPAVDLDRYLGRWYEIGSLPMFFQRHCVANTTAEYRRLDNGKIGVLNRCLNEKGGAEQAEGSAVVVDGHGNAQLKVTFMWPFRGDYWVIGLAPDYRWALVGTPNHRYLWLLSRTPQLSQTDIDTALAIAGEQGFKLDAWRRTRQQQDVRPGD